MRPPSISALLALLLVFAGACSRRSVQPTTSAGATSIEAGTRAPRRRPVTTSASIALGNLDADIAERRRRDDAAPEARLRLVELLLARSQYLGGVGDLEVADELSTRAIDEAPSRFEARLARALAHAALHRFDLAEAELDRASEVGAPGARVREVRVSLHLARGRYDEAARLNALDDAEHDRRGALDLATSAVIAARLLRHDQSERLFERASAQLRDVAPFPVAWIAFQHALVLEARGEDARAKELYAEACEVLPPYAHAAVHLAANELPERALARLDQLRSTEEDPDVLAALADAHRRAGHGADAERLNAQARARYAELVRRHAEAFGDHAARFYLGPGADPASALALAREDARRRSTEDALDLWMAAGAANARDDEVCRATAAMAALPWLTPRSRPLVVASSARCTDASVRGAPRGGH